MRTLLCALFLAGITPLFAGVTITFIESGSDVLVSANGTLDTSGLSLTYANRTAGTWDVYPQSGAFGVGSPDNRDLYSGVTSPGGSFGSGSFNPATIKTGDPISVSAGFIGLPIGYVSGATLTASNTFSGASLSSLGLTPGTYVWAWSSDSITLNISASAVPEPSTYAAFAGLAVFGLVLLRRRSSARSTVGRDR